MCLEELVEALTFAHYLKTQTLIRYEDLCATVEDLTRQGIAAVATSSEDQVMTDAADGPKQADATKPDPPATVSLTQDDYLYGIFDLTGEMMRFATTTLALTGVLAGSESSTSGDEPRTILQDMHDLGSFFEMLPVGGGSRFQWEKKLEVTRQSVQKVERLGYDWIIRGSEKPKGWVPDLSALDQGPPEEDE